MFSLTLQDHHGNLLGIPAPIQKGLPSDKIQLLEHSVDTELFPDNLIYRNLIKGHYEGLNMLLPQHKPVLGSSQTARGVRVEVMAGRRLTHPGLLQPGTSRSARPCALNQSRTRLSDQSLFLRTQAAGSGQRSQGSAVRAAGSGQRGQGVLCFCNCLP